MQTESLGERGSSAFLPPHCSRRSDEPQKAIDANISRAAPPEVIIKNTCKASKARETDSLGFAFFMGN
jgi:hypothetical protein